MEPGLVEVIHGRHNPMIDGAHGMHVWGWEVPVYLFIGGMVAGATILLALYELRFKEKPTSLSAQLVPWLLLPLMGIGLLALLVDLEYPTHVYRFFLAFQPASPMSWGGWLVLTVNAVWVAMGLGSLSATTQDWVLARSGPVAGVLRWAFDMGEAYRKPILWTALAFGVGVGIYTGLLLGTLVARPPWNTAILPPLFLTSGISSGAALMLLMPLSDKEQHTFVRWDAAAMAIELVLIVVMVISFVTGSAADQAAGHVFLGGHHMPAFWAIVVGGGLIVPLLLAGFEIAKNRPLTRLSPVLVLIGGFTLRWIIVVAGQEASFASLAMAH